MPRRLPIAAALLALAVALPGCGGDEEHAVTHGETEGVYLSVGGLKYQVQISRILNPQDPEDQAYFRGLEPEELELTPEEQWFGVFVRAENFEDTTAASADHFVIEDTTGKEFEPVELPEANTLGYQSRIVPPGELNPPANSAAADATTQGAVLLFKMTHAALENRPLELHIEGPPGAEPAEASVELDV